MIRCRAFEPGPIVGLLLALTGCGDCPDAFALSEQRVVRAGQRVVLTAPDGRLTVTGRERAATIEIEARGCRARGDTRIAFDTADGATGARVIARHADVRVHVPAGVELHVLHGSGDVDVSAVGPTTLEKRGGDVHITQAIGTAVVTAGPGTLYVRGVVGDVEVVDGPGAIFIEDVTGAVRMRDGSGGIHLRDIEGDVAIDADGSGGIDVRRVGGDFIVRAKSDDVRAVRHRDVSGRVSLPADAEP